MFRYFSYPLRITLIYFIFSLLWIYFSDNAINMLVTDIEKLKFLQTVKGWIFISLSSFLLYFLIKKYSKNLQKEKSKLTNTNEILKNIIENAPIMIFWKDKDGKYLGSNTQFLDFLNLKSKDELIGKSDADFQIYEKINCLNDDNSIITNKKPKLNYIETITTKNNTLRVVNTSKVPLFDEENDVIGILGVTQDITSEIQKQNQIKNQEELLMQQSRFASMGEMIENIAHQWRQPLSVISTLSTGIKLQKELNLSDEEYEKEALENINNNAQYLSKTIDDFKNFFKKNSQKTKINAKTLFEKTLNLINPRLKNRDISIVTIDNEVEFETFESEMIQVLINIVNNSIDALENIQTEKFIFMKIQKKSNHIILEIYDNANGIDEAILGKVFDAYFTTKIEGKGTGIGLYMSKEIITKHFHGNIKVSNTHFNYLDKDYVGALFTISLPLNKK